MTRSTIRSSSGVTCGLQNVCGDISAFGIIKRIRNWSMILGIGILSFGLSAKAQGTNQPSQSEFEQSSQRLFQELRVALAALNGEGSVSASRMLTFHASHSLNGQTVAVFKISHIMAADGSVTQKQYLLSSTPSAAASKSSPYGKRSGTPGPSWEEKCLYSPAAALSNILSIQGLTADLSTVTDPITGTPRDGIRIRGLPNQAGFIPAQIWFISQETHFPEAVAFYTPTPLVGPPRIGSMIVYKQFTQVDGENYPQKIIHKVRSGQVMTITVDQISESAETK